ncbi:hypothetical protein [Thermobifida cellulosilytica]|nr:hypothetical protein [Thermobifida cellulosilytica]
MSRILGFQLLEAAAEQETTGLVSTLSVVSPCPGWPSSFTWGNC